PRQRAGARLLCDRTKRRLLRERRRPGADQACAAAPPRAAPRAGWTAVAAHLRCRVVHDGQHRDSRWRPPGLRIVVVLSSGWAELHNGSAALLRRIGIELVEEPGSH